MIIYKVYPNSDKYPYLIGKTEKIRSQFMQFYELPLKTNWKTVSLKQTKGKTTDFWGLSGGTIIGIDQSKIQLLDNLQTHHTIELLPVSIATDELIYAINVLKIADVIDKQKAVLHYFTEDRIMYIETYAFQLEKVANLSLFVIKNFEQGGLFATDTFKKIIDEHQLTGLVFEEVWRSEEN